MSTRSLRWPILVGLLLATLSATAAANRPQPLAPGHGAPLTRAGFARYRVAFDRLLACAATDASPASCVTIWRNAAGPLLAGHPDTLVRGLVEYYVTQRLRGPGAESDCVLPATDA